MRANEFINEGLFGLGRQSPRLNQTFLDAFHAWQSNSSDLTAVEQAAAVILRQAISKKSIAPLEISTKHKQQEIGWLLRMLQT